MPTMVSDRVSRCGAYLALLHLALCHQALQRARPMMRSEDWRMVVAGYRYGFVHLFEPSACSVKSRPYNNSISNRIGGSGG